MMINWNSQVCQLQLLQMWMSNFGSLGSCMVTTILPFCLWQHPSNWRRHHKEVSWKNHYFCADCWTRQYSRKCFSSANTSFLPHGAQQNWSNVSVNTRFRHRRNQTHCHRHYSARYSVSHSSFRKNFLITPLRLPGISSYVKGYVRMCRSQSGTWETLWIYELMIVPLQPVEYWVIANNLCYLFPSKTWSRLQKRSTNWIVSLSWATMTAYADTNDLDWPGKFVIGRQQGAWIYREAANG